MDAKVSFEIAQKQAHADYFNRLELVNIKSLAEVFANLLLLAPHTDVQSAIRRWADIAPFLTISGDLISARQAD
jgi:gentisate 1,2-dioxygenase